MAALTSDKFTPFLSFTLFPLLVAAARHGPRYKYY
jgi:hypothetical protein